MKEAVANIPANASYQKLIKWTKLIAVTISAQAVIQLLGILTGFFIIRLLPIKEYAFYTLANAMLGTMTVLGDGGISTAVMAHGGKVWQDREKLGVIVSTGMELRKKFGIFSLLVSMPILFYLLTSHGANLLTSFLIILSIIPSFFSALSDSLLEIASKLHQGINKLQKNQLLAGVGRFVMMSSSLFLFPFTYIAILGNGIPRIWANFQLRKIASEYADLEQVADPIVRKEILLVTKRRLPGAIYFCFSGQITIWLVSIFGSTSSIAHIGALGRLTTILTLFTTLFNIVFVPRYARLRENRKLLINRFLLIQLCLFFVTALMLIIVSLFPTQLLWILGKGYNGLTKEFFLITISSCLAMTSGITFSLLNARGWIINSAIYVPINLAFQLILILTLDLSKTTNILLFSIADFGMGFFYFADLFCLPYCKNKQEKRRRINFRRHLECDKMLLFLICKRLRNGISL